MCFYNQKRFACGDWRWSNFAHPCKYEYRTGDTCGMRLVNTTEFEPTQCRLCDKIETKYRRRSAEMERLDRWKREGGLRIASLDRSIKLIEDLDKEIRQLQRDREDRRSLYGGRQEHTSQSQPSQATAALLCAIDPGLLQTPANAEADTVKDAEAHNAHSMLRNPCSDSGYASMLNPNDAKAKVTNGADACVDVDSRTEYSDTSTAAELRSEAFVTELADELFKSLTSVALTDHIMGNVIDVLPDILRAFALRIGYNAGTQIARDIMFFVHKHRHHIAACFRNRYFDEEAFSHKEIDDAPKIPLQAFIEEWLQGVDDVEEDIPTAPDIMDWEDDQEEYDTAEATAYRNFISQSPSYRWLLGKLLSEAHVATTDSSTLGEIRHEISSALPAPHNVSRKYSSQAYNVTFALDWDLMQFIKDQEYVEDPAEAFETAITLTGFANHAQALTCGQYLCQTWQSSGNRTIQLIKQLISGEIGRIITRTWTDGTSLTGSLNGSECIVQAVGPKPYVVEIGEQLAWVGAALRPSPFDSGIAYSEPYIHSIRLHMPSQTDHRQQCVYYLDCKISFRVHACDHTTELLNGACWHNLLQNPVLVKGFPIPHRSEENTGLEIPLDIMTRLARAQRTTWYQGKICIKGFSVILVPTKRVDDFILWHMLFNRDGKRISYSDCRIPNLPGLYPDNLTAADLYGTRHMLGWCSHVEDLTGAPEANYDIGWSRLRRPDVGCDFEKVSIIRGKLITFCTPVAIGLKDKAIHIPADSYEAQIRWIAKKFVMLYDAADQRAWLVDGASALLHLVRASLKENEKDDAKYQFLFASQTIVEASQTLTGKAAAISVLVNMSNRNLELYGHRNDGCRGVSAGEGGYNRFEDRVNQIYHTLEQIFDHQAQVNVELANGLRGDPSSSRLEGFDFMDIATDEDQFGSHVALLQSGNIGWTTLARSIHAITLFGRGFGNLLRPFDPHQICHPWVEVPKGKDLLATRASHLCDILRKKGDPDANPWQLVEGILWYMPDQAFEECQCATSNSNARCNRVQVLIPAAHIDSRNSALRSPSHLEPHGAVIFGPAWGTGTVTQDGSPSRARSENRSVDSGIGFSLGSSTGSQEGRSFGQKRRRPLRSQYESSSHEYSSTHTSGSIQTKRTKLMPFDEDTFSDDSNHSTDLQKLNRKVPQASRMDSLAKRAVIPTFASGPAPIVPTPNDAVSMPPEAAYRVGWICALKVELDAALKMFDQFYGRGFGHGRDNNIYTLGRIGQHNVVVSCLPMGRYGTGSAAIVATRMMSKFPNIQIGLMVGIGGGIPNEVNDIRLGDVIVSKPSGEHGGVIQYDLGKATANGFMRTGFLNAPPEVVLAVLNLMPAHDSTFGKCPRTQYPGQQFDFLHDPTYNHVSGRTCGSCDTSRQVQRVSGNRDAGPRVFYGTIASGNTVIKDAAVRDKLGKVHGALCFEMEAAGLMNSNFPCIVIRGVSDYADSHKNDNWIEYAASAAAEYSRIFLYAVPSMI